MRTIKIGIFISCVCFVLALITWIATANIYQHIRWRSPSCHFEGDTYLQNQLTTLTALSFWTFIATIILAMFLMLIWRQKRLEAKPED